MLSVKECKEIRKGLKKQYHQLTNEFYSIDIHTSTCLECNFDELETIAVTFDRNIDKDCVMTITFSKNFECLDYTVNITTNYYFSPIKDECDNKDEFVTKKEWYDYINREQEDISRKDRCIVYEFNLIGKETGFVEFMLEELNEIKALNYDLDKIKEIKKADEFKRWLRN